MSLPIGEMLIFGTAFSRQRPSGKTVWSALSATPDSARAKAGSGESAREEAGWYFHRLDGPKASWISEAIPAEQKRLLPPLSYSRLWLKQWTSGSGDALTVELIDQAIRLHGPTSEREPGWLYVAGVDLGISRDASAVVTIAKHVGHVEEKTRRKIRTSTQMALIDMGLVEADDDTESIYHEGTGRIKLVDVRRWKPAPGNRVSVSAVEKSIERLHQRFGPSEVAVDPWQAELLCERLDAKGIPVRQVPFTGGNLQSMAVAVLESFNASLEESVGEFWFGEGAEVVVEGDFVGFLGAETV